ncbi:hypothetical protein [Tardiphaga robiniae]|uniref:hypothetical protein n=1 Tax=Tardiphaga robiniae TaxID=943830 RepID=UPI001111CB07|nr:hypothetical protein [Tardiphaga robiniae]
MSLKTAEQPISFPEKTIGRALHEPTICRGRFAMNFKLELRSGKALCTANQSSDVKHRMIAFALKT